MAPPSYEEIRRFVDFRLLPPRICLPLNRGVEGRNEIRRKPRLEQEAGVSLIEFRLIVFDEYISISKFRYSLFDRVFEILSRDRIGDVSGNGCSR